jgi:[acyl-carrier-protein] S-malonyltransferase
VAEQAVIGAFEQEGCIPIAAVRPGLVLEDYAHGEFDRNQWFPTFVAKCLQDGKMPLIELEGTPVEQICQSIVRMAVCEPTSNTVGGVHEKDRDTRLFHNLCTFYKADRLADELNKALAHDGNTTTTEGDSLKRKLASDKPLLQVVPMEEWKRSMLSVPQDQQVHPIYRFTAKMKGLRENSYGSFEVQHGRPYAEDWSALIGRVLGLRDFNLATAAADAAATRDDIRRADKRPRVNDVGTGKVGSGKLVVLFPGQGTQRVGMMAKTLETPEAQWVLQEAAQVLGYDLGTLMAHGPQQKLEDTEFAQPAIFVCSYIAFLSLKRTYPAMAKRFEQQVIDHEEKQQEEDGSRAGVHFAGFSLGEYTALAAAGVLTFADALRLVQVRAKSMKSAASARVGAMATVVGLSDQVLNEVVAKTLKARQDAQAQSLKDSMKEGGGSAETGLVTLSVANYLFENCRVLSGDLKSIEAVEVACKEAGASRIIRQKVSGAFHSPLMQTAVSAVRKELMVGCKLHSTPVHVYSNVSGGEHRGVVRVPSSVTSTASSTLDIQVSKSDVAAGAAAGVLADDLCAQLVSAVQWETTLHSLLRCPSGDEPPTVVALGPGRSLIAMLARIDKNAADKTLWMGE